MRGKRGSAVPWSTYFKSSERLWVIKYRDPHGKRHEERIPREEVASPDGKELADRYAKRWYSSYRRTLATTATDSARQMPPQVERVPVLAEFAGRWLALREQLKKAGTIKSATYKQDKGVWNTHIEPALGQTEITRLTSGVLRPFVRDLAGKLAPHTVHNIVNVLTVMLDDIAAEEWFSLPFNPARDPKVREILPPRVKRAGKHVVIHLDQAQAEQLLNCRFVPTRRRIRYLLTLLTGLRDGELAGLRFDDARSVEGMVVLSVTKALALVSNGRGPGLQAPKTENCNRKIPLHSLAAEAFAWWREIGWALWVGRKPTDADLIFPSHEGKPSRPRSADDLRTDLVIAGLPAKFDSGECNFVFHALRASFCTWLEEEDASEGVKARLMGQGAVSTADGHYTSKSFARLRAAIESLKLAVTLDALTTYEKPPRKPRVKKEAATPTN